MSETAAVETTQAQAAAPQVTKQKGKQGGDLILDIAHEIENTTKVKAINETRRLVQDLDRNSFRIGGYLKVIQEQAWYEGHESFDAFVAAEFGFKGRKARYLIEIYTNLVEKHIPWEKVQHLGWTKLKDLAPVLTLENLEDWIQKAAPLTVIELQNLLKQSGEGGGETKTTSDTTTVKFKLKTDQVSTVQSALSKAKAETGTEFDNVALEMICAGYLGGTVQAAQGLSLEEQMKKAGWKEAIQLFDKLYTDVVDITITEK